MRYVSLRSPKQFVCLEPKSSFEIISFAPYKYLYPIDFVKVNNVLIPSNVGDYIRDEFYFYVERVSLFLKLVGRRESFVNIEGPIRNSSLFDHWGVYNMQFKNGHLHSLKDIPVVSIVARKDAHLIGEGDSASVILTWFYNGHVGRKNGPAIIYVHLRDTKDSRVHVDVVHNIYGWNSLLHRKYGPAVVTRSVDGICLLSYARKGRVKLYYVYAPYTDRLSSSYLVPNRCARDSVKFHAIRPKVQTNVNFIKYTNSEYCDVNSVLIDNILNWCRTAYESPKILVDRIAQYYQNRV